MGDLDEVAEFNVRQRFGQNSAREDPITTLLGQQQASGLWGSADGVDDVARAVGTAKALLDLLDHGITTSHPTHGAQVRKAVEALTKLLASVAQVNAAAAEFAASVAWLVATGPRSRAELERALATERELQALRPSFADEAALRTRVHALSAQLR